MITIERRTHETKTDIRAYDVVNDTWYDAGTDPDLLQTLEIVRKNNWRVLISKGYSSEVIRDRYIRYFTPPEEPAPVGVNWIEQFECTGYISRCRGGLKRPLILFNSRTRYGGTLSSDCIVRVMRGNQVLWRHPRYREPIVTSRMTDDLEYPAELIVDGKVQCRFATFKKLRYYVHKLKIKAPLEAPPLTLLVDFDTTDAELDLPRRRVTLPTILGGAVGTTI